MKSFDLKHFTAQKSIYKVVNDFVKFLPAYIRVLERLTAPQRVKKFPTLYGA